MLHIVSWLWGSKFAVMDAVRLRDALRRNVKQPFEFHLISDHRDASILGTRIGYRPIPSSVAALTRVKGCFARLKMFDPSWQENILEGDDDDRIVCMDLDSVITGQLDPMLNRSEPFVIMQGGNAANPCPYNGALMMLRPGAHSDVWSTFSLDAAAKIPFYEFPDDQGWLAHKVPGAAGWKCGVASGVFVYGKPGWPKGDALPEGAKFVTFNGARRPSNFMHLDWVRNNWQ